MTDSPIADDYDQYRLLDGEVVKFVTNCCDVICEPGNTIIEHLEGGRDIVNGGDLTRPTRLHLQLAGDDDSPGGLLDEGDIREGEWVISNNWAPNTPLQLQRVKGPHGCCQINDASLHADGIPRRHHDDALLDALRLATPAELREAGIEPPEFNGEQPEDDDVDVSDAANRYVATELQIAALRRLREAVEATERDEYARASVRATAAIGLIDDIIDREPSTDVDDTPSNPFGCCDDPNCGGCRDCPDCGASMGHESGLPKCFLCMADHEFHNCFSLEGNDTRTCPRCPGKSFTIIETVSRQRSATLDTTGRMHCGEPEGEEVVDRRMRCDCCQYEWRREGWEVIDG